MTIPSRFQEQSGVGEGTKLIVVVTAHEIVLKKLDVPSVEESQQQVGERYDNMELLMELADKLVHDACNAD